MINVKLKEQKFQRKIVFVTLGNKIRIPFFYRPSMKTYDYGKKRILIADEYFRKVLSFKWLKYFNNIVAVFQYLVSQPRI